MAHGYASAPAGYGAPRPMYGAPPPAGGYGAPAPPGYAARPTFNYQQPMVQNPRAFALFQSVDSDRSGSVSARELQTALSSGGMVFNPRAIKTMIRMFDLDNSAF
jgi:hypothetical protein